MAEPKIYISSTFGDLEEHRKAVVDILRTQDVKVIAMEDYVATDERPLDKCLADVADSDIYVGIIAWRYGFIPPKENPEKKSITELEYLQAGESDIPRLIFLLKEDAEWSPRQMDAYTGEGDQGKRNKAFRDALQEGTTLRFFDSEDELAGLVLAAVGKVLIKRQPERAQGEGRDPAQRASNYVKRLNVETQEMDSEIHDYARWTKGIILAAVVIFTAGLVMIVARVILTVGSLTMLMGVLSGGTAYYPQISKRSRSRQKAILDGLKTGLEQKPPDVDALHQAKKYYEKRMKALESL